VPLSRLFKKCIYSFSRKVRTRHRRRWQSKLEDVFHE